MRDGGDGALFDTSTMYRQVTVTKRDFFLHLRRGMNKSLGEFQKR